MRYSVFCDDCNKPIMKKSVKAKHEAIMRGEIFKPSYITAVFLVARMACKCED